MDPSTSRELEDWLYEADAEPAATFNDKRTALRPVECSGRWRSGARPKTIEKFRKASRWPRRTRRRSGPTSGRG